MTQVLSAKYCGKEREAEKRGWTTSDRLIRPPSSSEEAIAWFRWERRKDALENASSMSCAAAHFSLARET